MIMITIICLTLVLTLLNEVLLLVLIHYLSTNMFILAFLVVVHLMIWPGVAEPKSFLYVIRLKYLDDATTCAEAALPIDAIIHGVGS
jgi:hypothetical protein